MVAYERLAEKMRDEVAFKRSNHATKVVQADVKEEADVVMKIAKLVRLGEINEE